MGYTAVDIKDGLKDQLFDLQKNLEDVDNEKVFLSEYQLTKTQ